MSDKTTIFYDLPSKGHCACWSYNPWKSKWRGPVNFTPLSASPADSATLFDGALARLALNYKNIDYKTEWLEYPDIAPTLKDLSVAHFRSCLFGMLCFD